MDRMSDPQYEWSDNLTGNCPMSAVNISPVGVATLPYKKALFVMLVDRVP